MQLAQQIKGAGLGAFPCAVVFNDKKGKYEKKPLTVDREHWAATAHRPNDDQAVNWHGVQVVGVPIPPGVVVLDLDTYKPGVSPEMAATILGADMPWGRAFLQSTISGGNHYAFRLPEWQVKQGSNIGGPSSGIDTRVAGIGFICTGEGYTGSPDGGVFKMAHPESLPVLPEGCRRLLEKVAAEKPTTPAELPADSDRDPALLVEALRHIDPSERDTWRDIGFALKHHFHDDEPTGFEIWDRWSAGEYWPDGCPASYNGDSQAQQWGSFQAVKEGATITVGTLFHSAVKGGWTPPARFDTAMAFGPGAVPAETFNDLVAQILELGGDSRNTEQLLKAITSSGCNEVQAVLLRNELKAVMRSAKILDKDLGRIIDQATTPAKQTVASGLYDKNHTENAQLFLDANYPQQTLIRSGEVWYCYNGKCWQEVEDDALSHQLTMAMLPSRPQSSTVSGSYSMLSNMTHKAGANMSESPAGLVVFQNGVLDVNTGQLLPHDMAYLTTKIVPYNYNPEANAPRWVTFVNEVLEGDQERIALLQEWLGYMMAPCYDFQKVMLMIGPRRCGKGTIGNVMAELVGQLNYTGLSLSSFYDDDYLESLQHKTVAFSGDTAKSVNHNKLPVIIERLKKISGNDHVDFKRKYKSRMTCKLPTRITLAGNHIPKLFDDSEALAGRLLVLPFEVSWYNREDPKLLPALLNELEGIALWALQGLARLNTNRGFTLPEASKAEMQYIEESYSPLRQFIDSRCSLGGEPVVAASDLYDSYRAWATLSGEDHILTRKTFVSAFKDATRGKGCKYGPQRIDGNVVRGFKGIHLRRDVESPTASAFKPQVIK